MAIFKDKEMEQDFTALKKEHGELEQKLDQREGELKTASEEQATLKGELTVAQDEVKALKVDLKASQEKVTKLEGAQSDFDEKVSLAAAAKMAELGVPEPLKEPEGSDSNEAVKAAEERVKNAKDPKEKYQAVKALQELRK